MTELFESGEPWFAAAGILLLGIIVAVVVGTVVRWLGRRLLHDEQRAGSAAIAAFWGVIAVFGFVAVVRLFGGSGAGEGLARTSEQVYQVLPGVFLAVLVGVFGLLLAAAARLVLARALERVRPRLAEPVATLAYWLLVVLTALLAARQVGIETRLLEALVLLLVGGVVLAGALAAGLGGRDLVAALAAGRHVARIVGVGDEVEVDGLRGRVVALGHASVRIATADAEVEVPNRAFLDATVAIHARADTSSETQTLPRA